MGSQTSREPSLAIGLTFLQQILKIRSHQVGSHSVAPLGYCCDNGYGFFETAIRRQIVPIKQVSSSVPFEVLGNRLQLRELWLNPK